MRFIIAVMIVLILTYNIRVLNIRTFDSLLNSYRIIRFQKFYNLFAKDMSKNPERKRPLGRSQMRWEDVVKRNVESLNGRSNWKKRAADREDWRIVCLM